MNSDHESIVEGTVVIVDTGQAGTVVQKTHGGIVVLLQNLNLWHGHPGKVYVPTTQEELDAAILEIDRFAQREKGTGKKKRTVYTD